MAWPGHVATRWCCQAGLGWEEEEGRALLAASQGDSADVLGHQPLPLATSPSVPPLGAGLPTACTPSAPCQRPAPCSRSLAHCPRPPAPWPRPPSTLPYDPSTLPYVPSPLPAPSPLTFCSLSIQLWAGGAVSVTGSCVGRTGVRGTVRVGTEYPEGGPEAGPSPAAPRAWDLNAAPTSTAPLPNIPVLAAGQACQGMTPAPSPGGLYGSRSAPGQGRGTGSR